MSPERPLQELLNEPPLDASVRQASISIWDQPEFRPNPDAGPGGRASTKDVGSKFDLFDHLPPPFLSYDVSYYTLLCPLC